MIVRLYARNREIEFEFYSWESVIRRIHEHAAFAKNSCVSVTISCKLFEESHIVDTRLPLTVITMKNLFNNPIKEKDMSRIAHRVPRKFTCYGSPFMKVDPVAALQTSGLVKSILSTECDIFAVNLETGELTIISKKTLIKEGVLKESTVQISYETTDGENRLVRIVRNYAELTKGYDDLVNIIGDNFDVKITARKGEIVVAEVYVRAGSNVSYKNRTLHGLFIQL